ncbi:MAG TPA: acetate/propionate family kinase [Chitinophagaceae bacterium]|nr:acetate/propionate family kinase [Chitinophagaceae bacterium]
MLIINGGSSSIKFAIFDNSLKRKTGGNIERIGTKDCRLIIPGNGAIKVHAKEIQEAALFLLTWLEQQNLLSNISTATHRVVQGMHYSKPQIITSALLKQLTQFTEYDPEHLPGEIMLIKAVKKHLPYVKQVACFDTAFHSSMPKTARLLPLPQAYYKKGIKKYGFHGLSYTYIMHSLKKVDAVYRGKGKVVIAHLGNGASITAVKNGKSVDTSMGFTPTGGLVMGTRTGDLDPGVAWYMMAKEKLTPAKFNKLVNRQSGLLGLSGISADMQQLLKSKNVRAAEAIDLFCYDVKKYIGAYTAVLGGIDTLVFTGGIGAHAPRIREKVCEGLQYLGINIDKKANKQNNEIISPAKSSIRVYVMATNEEYMMAKLTKQLLAHT